ncbi:hypothetical protein PanWU01x14_151180 [Parasponia andersonii]|uniref:Uncharacterized protein n=1 Tax=Parasponia andersonii TaxID=3476 RepID=A0A2P5CI25_PARAD|nr:hypothetical protein PanWU01x14_151180 [Parasponia andersonii]
MGPDFKHRLRVEGEDFYKASWNLTTTAIFLIVRVMINERSRTKALSSCDWDDLQIHGLMRLNDPEMVVEHPETCTDTHGPAKALLTPLIFGEIYMSCQY